MINSPEEGADKGGPREKPTGALRGNRGGVRGGERGEAEAVAEEARLSSRAAWSNRLQRATPVRTQSRGSEDG